MVKCAKLQYPLSDAAIRGLASWHEQGEEYCKQQLYAIPVCGIPVDINNPNYFIEYPGEFVYGCRPGKGKDAAGR